MALRIIQMLDYDAIYSCEICHKSLKNFRGISLHLRRMHNDISFESYKSTYHIDTSNAIKEKRKCLCCNKSIVSNKFKTHLTRRHNLGYKRYCNKFSIPVVNIFDGKIINEDYVVCTICGYKTTVLSSHLRYSHNIKPSDYNGKLMCNKMHDFYSNKIVGNLNPAYQHGGKYSPFSKKFVKGNIVDKTAKKVRKHRKQNGNDVTSINYWLKKSNDNLELASELLKNRQTTFNLEKCINKYGKEKGRERWKRRQWKWIRNFKKNNFSKISQELFNLVMKEFGDNNVYYATYDNPFDNALVDYKNKEYRLKLSDRVIMPDFFVPSSNKIIEFQGTYWHTKGNNAERDVIRIKDLLDNGYLVLEVREFEFRKDKSKVVSECLEFLND